MFIVTIQGNGVRSCRRDNSHEICEFYYWCFVGGKWCEFHFISLMFKHSEFHLNMVNIMWTILIFDIFVETSSFEFLMLVLWIICLVPKVRYLILYYNTVETKWTSTYLKSCMQYRCYAFMLLHITIPANT